MDNRSVQKRGNDVISKCEPRGRRKERDTKFVNGLNMEVKEKYDLTPQKRKPLTRLMSDPFMDYGWDQA
jgi:hypothetical protein